MPSEPRYWGTKQAKIIKAIAVDSIHDWRGLQSATQFTEKELNYNLFLLFQDTVLRKSDRQYYLIPSLEDEYKAYYYPVKESSTKSKPIQKVRVSQSVYAKPRNFINNEIVT